MNDRNLYVVVGIGERNVQLMYQQREKFCSLNSLMTSFRKLPTIAPTTKRKAGISQFVMENNLFYRNE